MDVGIAFLGSDDSRAALDWARRLDADERVTRLWVADERFLRDPWVQLGALAAATSRVHVGICVTDPFIRHPALTAAAAATLDELSGRRALLGLGAGATGFAALDLAHGRPALAVQECIELCRRLWAERGPLTYEGRIVRFADDRLHFEPLRPVPIYVAARGPRMLAAAAEHADAVLIGNFVGGRGLDYALRALDETERRRSSALPPLRRAAWLYLSVAADAAAARAAAARGLALALWSSRSLLVEIGYELPHELVAFLDTRGRSLRGDEVDAVARLVPDELVDDFTVAGDPASCAAKLRRLSERGVEEIAVLPFAPAGASERDVVEALLADVLPAAQTEVAA
jgi:5,10-methylenetetrahydromethanopterin reductase